MISKLSGIAKERYLILKSANAIKKYNVGKTLARTGKVLGVAGMVATVLDANEKGWKPHHGVDLVLGAAFTFCPALWGVGLAYLAADLATQYFTGRSISENLFDGKQ